MQVREEQQQNEKPKHDKHKPCELQSGHEWATIRITNAKDVIELATCENCGKIRSK